jgi:cytochrome P450
MSAVDRVARDARHDSAIEMDFAKFSHFDQAYASAPEPTWEALRGHPTIPHSDEHGGFYAIARHTDVCRAARNTALFSSAKGNAIPPFPFPPLIPVNVDPPKLHLYRKILNPHLAPRALAAREPEIRAMAHALMDELLAKAESSGEIDFLSDFAESFPQQVALRVIGFPDADRHTTAKAIYDLSHLRGIDDTLAEAAAMQVMARITEFIGERRAAPRTDDLISALLDGDIEGRPLDDQELLFYVFLLLFGGLDTTTAATAGTFAYLGQHPEAREALRSDPELRDTAVDEFVRWTCPVQGLGRTLTRDASFAGCPMKQDERVLLLWAAGNRDETVFEHPDEVRLDRSPNHHLSFGMGPHRCIGSHLGRLMLDVAIDVGLERLGEFHVVDPENLRWVGGETMQLKALALRLGPAPAGAPGPPPEPGGRGPEA